MGDSVCDHSQATTSGGRIVVEAVVSPDAVGAKQVLMVGR
jgi:hypothetical protein